jgi:hypothetical protein
MVYSLLRLGFGDEPRVKAGIGWICENQRFDDGVADPQGGTAATWEW